VWEFPRGWEFDFNPSGGLVYLSEGSDTPRDLAASFVNSFSRQNVGLRGAIYTHNFIQHEMV